MGDKINSSSERFRLNALNDQKANGASILKEDSSVKLNSEEESDGIGDAVPCKSSLRETSFYFEGVRFSPKVIEFIDAFEGKQFAVKIKIQNVDKKPVLVRIGEPNSFIFQLKKPSRRVRLLASGSSLTKTITYSYHNDDLVQKSQIPIQINGRFIDYPIVVKKATPEITVEPSQLNFKKINLGASAKTMVLTIHNSGGRRTKFEIDLGKNDLDLVVTPIGGTIKAKSKVTVVVEMMGMAEGEYFKELWVTTNEMSTRVPVIVEVVRPRLEIIHPNVTEDFVLIDFPPTFVNTQRSESFLLKNYSADTTLFITLAEIGGSLQFLKDARKNHETCRVFMFTAEEGRLEPFESRVETALFSPKGTTTTEKGWHQTGGKNSRKKEIRSEHIVFVRMRRVHCIEIKELAKVEAKPTFNTVKERSDPVVRSIASLTSAYPGPPRNLRTSNYVSRLLDFGTGVNKSSGFLASNSLEEKVLRLCLHGTAVEPDIVVQPSRFDLERTEVGRTLKRVLTVRNDSLLGVKYNFPRIANVVVTPSRGWLEPNEALEFLISVTPTSGGKSETGIKIEILAKSDVVFENDSNLVTVANLFVPLTYTANLVPPKLVPKIGFGISPVLTNDVGFLKELATFKSDCEKPRAAMLAAMSKTMKPDWMKREPDQVANVDNALIAFPNDRPRNYYSWAKENICRTIFKGFFRYSPPEDTKYTMTPEERILKKKNYLLWKDYLKVLQSHRMKEFDSGNLDLICEQRFISENLQPVLKLPSTAKLLAKVNKVLERKVCHPKHDLVPLSPQHLNNINVEPKLINFGTVATNNLVHETLTVYNMNPFPIGIRFVPGKTAVKVVDGDTIIISPFVTNSLAVSFETNELGRHYGFLNYVINGSHEFKITISAYVTSKTLMLEDKNLVIEFGNCPAEYAFQPRCTFLELGNLLQSPITYHWQLPVDSAFFPDNLKGEVPPRIQLLTEIKFDMQPKKSFYSELNLVSESGSSELIKLIYAARRAVSVFFLTSRIDVGDVPLNLPTKVVPVIRNACYHGVVFEVVNWNPIPGVVVQPRQGVLKPRSFLSLEITIQIPVIMKFSFDLLVYVHLSQKISVKITGSVVVPVIRIKPAEVVMRKICSNSFDTVALCIENAGSTPAEIDIDLQGCPEYSVVDDKSHLCLPPSSHSKVNIRFQPKDVARYVFYLPIIVNKILGPPMLQEPQTEHLGFYVSTFESLYEGHGKVHRSENIKMKIPCVCINSTVSPSLLAISSSNIYFRSLTSAASECQTIAISNDFFDEVTFCIRNDDLGEANESPFDLLPVNEASIEMRSKAIKARLKQGEKLVLKAVFNPKKPGFYEVDIPLFVRGYSDGRVYNYINLKGELKKPELRADFREIHFPPLPLNVGCDVIVSILAENYVSPDTISCLVWSPPDGGDTFSKFLSVEWLNDPKINPLLDPQIFQIQVTFSSPVPVGLRNYLAFVDSCGNECSVLVTATADNSAVTTHAFLTTRASKYKLLRDASSTKSAADDSGYPLSKKQSKPVRLNKKCTGKKGPEVKNFTNPPPDAPNNVCSFPVDKGSRLVVQATKSMTRLTRLNFVNLSKESFPNKGKECSSMVLNSLKSRVINSSSQSDSYSTARSVDRFCREPETKTDVTHPNFPLYHDTPYGKHFQETLAYLERWMFEVVMRCDQYLEIPKSFQKLRIENVKSENATEKSSSKNKSSASAKNKVEKDFLDFLEEVVDADMRESLPRRSPFEENNRSENLYLFYAEILNYLTDQGCHIPHVRAEHLLGYEDYLDHVTNHSTSTDAFKWKFVDREKKIPSKNAKEHSASSPKVNLEKDVSLSSSIFNRGTSWDRSFLGDNRNVSDDHVVEEEDDEEKTEEKEKIEMRLNLVEGKQFVHESKILDKGTQEARSTQAWLDITIQIFRTIVLTRIGDVTAIPEIEVSELSEQINAVVADVKSYGSSRNRNRHDSTMLENNLYNIQERILLMWLNKHYADQREILFPEKERNETPPRPIINFDKDLADSIALILVTAAYCPYVVDQFFSDIFLKPDNPSKMHHNASKLTLAWKTLNIGLTVESLDLVNPNPVFMIILVAQLYKVLPTLHPNFRINFSAPLSSDFVRTITIRNDYRHSVFYQVKFMGEHEGLFRLKTCSQMIQAKASNSTEVQVIFTARRIKRVSAILLLCGYVISPHFAQHLVFSLEGGPSDFRECTKLSFSAPLYKVLCTEIPICPPYSEPTTYDIWYSTNKPEYKESSDIFHCLKPWSKIWNRKVARRLFLNKCDITIGKDEKTAPLGVAVACLTGEERNFWLLFRSFNVGEFIVLINIKANVKTPIATTSAYFPSAWSSDATCACTDTVEERRVDLGAPYCRSCPFFTELNVPMRNHCLWDSVKSMFLRTLHAQEKSFWSKHFEKNIGLCLVLWFISMEEEEDVADEFIHILQTRVLYNLRVEPPHNKYLTVPPQIEIPDVRENSEIKVPIHVSPGAPNKLKFFLTLTSEDGKELRRLKVALSVPNPKDEPSSVP